MTIGGKFTILLVMAALMLSIFFNTNTTYWIVVLVILSVIGAVFAVICYFDECRESADIERAMNREHIKQENNAWEEEYRRLLKREETFRNWVNM